jgi:hypothetical protein
MFEAGYLQALERGVVLRAEIQDKIRVYFLFSETRRLFLAGFAVGREILQIFQLQPAALGGLL